MTFHAQINSRRAWFVPNYQVWGQAGLGGMQYLAYEQLPVASVLYGQTDIGDSAQSVRFDSLTDHRGNQLPATIDNPRVMIRPRQPEAVFLVGTESSDRFKIARDGSGNEAVTVDLLIIEMGD